MAYGEWDLKAWHEIPIGSIVTEAGSSKVNKTGSWRMLRPVLNYDKCTHCLICWIFCPDDSIPVNPQERFETDFEYCKGCGICAVECPYNALEMVPEMEIKLKELEKELG